MRSNGTVVMWLIASLLVFGCHHDSSARHGVAYFTGVKGFEVVGGGARLEETRPGVRFVVWINQAPPGPKAVHVHESGDCSDALAAKRYPTDLGSLMVRDDGNGWLEVSTTAGNLVPGDRMSFLNRAIVIDQAEDKKPLACAVIKVN